MATLFLRRTTRAWPLFVVLLVVAGTGAVLLAKPTPPQDGEPAVSDTTPISSNVVGTVAAMASKATATPVWLPYPGRGFAINATEVTVAQFDVCAKSGACKAEYFEKADGRGPCNYGRDDRADHPMNCVDWFGADAYCTSIGARLCSFEEWIGACAGTEGRPYPYGSQYDAMACHGASRENPVASRPQHTLPVGHLGTCQGGLPNLYDMAGNVMEWVSGCKDSYCKFLGGAYLGNEPLDLFNSCKGPCGGNQKTFRSATIGFRCCKDGPGE